MQIETLPMSQLQPAPYNPRIELGPGMPGYEKLSRSLDEFDLVQPLVWNRRTGFLVGGHQRRAILEARGVTETPCVVVDLDPDREKALNVALNNAQVGGDFDPLPLKSVLEELSQSDLDAELTGFSEADINEMVLGPAADFTPIAEPDRTHVTATLDIPHEDWDAVQTVLGSVLESHPSVRVHVEGE